MKKTKPPIFAAMEAINHDHELDKSEKNVLRAILKYANKDTGECWPSVPTLARDTGMSVRGVQGVLRRLEDKGRLIIVFLSRGGVGRNHGRGIPNRWRLNLIAPSVQDNADTRRKSDGNPVEFQTPHTTTPNPAAGASNPATSSHNPAVDNGEPRSQCGGRAIESSIEHASRRAIEQPSGHGSLSRMGNGARQQGSENQALREELARCGVTGPWLDALARSSLSVEDVKREWRTIQYRSDIARKPAMLVHRLKAKCGIALASDSDGPGAAVARDVLRAMRGREREGPRHF